MGFGIMPVAGSWPIAAGPLLGLSEVLADIRLCPVRGTKQDEAAAAVIQPFPTPTSCGPQ
jgi:hypothetical protein